MKIKSLRVRDFKRFSDLTVGEIPETARLVVLVGPNGSGKSSLFEAFNFWISPFRGANYQQDYHAKTGTALPNNWPELHKKIQLEFHGVAPNPHESSERSKKTFYFRSAYRNEPDFSSSAVQRAGDALDDQRRPPSLISPDTRVSDNYQRIVAETVAEVYRYGDDEMPKGQIRERIIGKVRHAMKHVFDNLILAGPGDPMTDGTFFFDKGSSRGWRYKNLSGGEKAAFDLLLDFVLKAQYFNDTVFCVDEPELHMHTRLQGKLLEEMFKQLPTGCQLWVATHSIGMMRKALDLHGANPGSVVFLDFEEKDFDVSQQVKPITVNRTFWKRICSVALDDLSQLVGPAEFIFCEGAPVTSQGRRNTEFDAKVYRMIFSSAHPDTEFISLGGTNDVEKDAITVAAAIGQVFTGIRMARLLDRDDRGDSEIAELRANGTRVLARRSIESYLWDDDVLRKLCDVEGRADLADGLLKIKSGLLADSAKSGNPSDNLKRVGGLLYVETKKLLELTQCGNNTESFALQKLAPLVTSELAVFAELEKAIFGNG